jgi:cytochrome c oxidase assembly factor CtaG
MLEHVLLAQVIPLLVVRRLDARFHVPIPAGLSWAIGVTAIVAASVPPVFATIEHDAPLALAVRGLLLASGIIFWRPVWSRRPRIALGPPIAVLYLVSACFATTLAGAYVAFTATSTDQQIAGLVMWVPCCLIYLGAVLLIVGRSLYGEHADVTRAE